MKASQVLLSERKRALPAVHEQHESPDSSASAISGEQHRAAHEQHAEQMSPAKYIFTLTQEIAAQREETRTVIEFQRIMLVGLQYHDTDAALALPAGAVVSLVREPHNEFDRNAIRILSPNISDALDSPSTASDEDDGDQGNPRVCLGMLMWQQAKELAPHLDAGNAVIVSASLAHGDQDDDPRAAARTRAPRTSGGMLPLYMCVEAWGEAVYVLQHQSPFLNNQKVIQVIQMSLDISLREVSEALSRSLAGLGRSSSSWAADATEARPWQPTAGWTVTEKVHPTWLQTFAEGALLRNLGLADVERAQAHGFPPPDDILVSLGLAPADDEAWWCNHGLRCPRDWVLSGAVDFMPDSRQSVSANKLKASALLDGAAHGLTPWLPATLAAAESLLHEQDFWCRRNNEAYIRAFGGPYVLGQEPAKIKLVRGAEHTELTALICRAHNLIYTAVHLAHPAGPGFNTLIFGLNLRSAGFYYHQVSDSHAPSVCLAHCRLALKANSAVTTGLGCRQFARQSGAFAT
jgi:hypothetical protein